MDAAAGFFGNPQKEMHSVTKTGLLEKTHHKRSSQYLSALAKKVKKKRLQPVEVAAVL